jgi:putative phosphatase
MIYIGDGLTDVPCMKLAKSYGGQSIAIYNLEKGKKAAEELKKADRVNFITPADYEIDSEIEIIVKAIIKKFRLLKKCNLIIINFNLKNSYYIKT